VQLAVIEYVASSPAGRVSLKETCVNVEFVDGFESVNVSVVVSPAEIVYTPNVLARVALLWPV
jgi:hypothetical protein